MENNQNVIWDPPVLWAKLPNEIMASPSILAFKKAIKNPKLSEFIEECNAIDSVKSNFQKFLSIVL